VRDEAPQGFVVLTLRFRSERGRWTGECLELGTATYGRTLKQVHDELIELVTLHLNSLEEVGEREHFFRTHNIHCYTGETPSDVTRPLPVDGEFYTQAQRIAIRVPA
jgi:hypothetical protein